MGLTPEAVAQLRAPFKTAEVEWRPGSTGAGGTIGLAYADKHTYARRLSEVDPGWTCRYEVGDSGGTVRCVLTVCGIAREDFGEGDDEDTDKTPRKNNLTTMLAQSFKRACTMFGVGDYLYYLGKPAAPLNSYKQYERPALDFFDRVHDRMVALLVEGKSPGEAQYILDRETEQLRGRQVSRATASAPAPAAQAVKDAQFTAPHDLPSFWAFVSLEWAKAMGVTGEEARAHAKEVLASTGQDFISAFEKMSIEAVAGGQPTNAPPPEDAPPTKMCAIHNVEMVQRISLKTGKPYFGHKVGDNKMCFGREE